MTPEKHLVLPMYNSLNNLLTYSQIGTSESLCIELFDVIFGVVKLISFGDMNGVNRDVVEYYRSLHHQGVEVPVEQLNNTIRECSLSILKEFMENDLIDYIHYVVDFDSNKIVIRAYRLDTSVDTNRGVENVF